MPRAYVQLKPTAGDVQVWQTMDQTALAFAQKIAGAAGNIEYLYDGGWKTQLFPLHRPFP